MNKKIITATALITLTGILAGCARSLPAANDTTYRPPVETVKPQETQAASDMEHVPVVALLSLWLSGWLSEKNRKSPDITALFSL